MNDFTLDKMPDDRKPQVILVKKFFAEKSHRNRQRVWKLHRLEREAAASNISQEVYVVYMLHMTHTTGAPLTSTVWSDTKLRGTRSRRGLHAVPKPIYQQLRISSSLARSLTDQINPLVTEILWLPSWVIFQD